MRKCELLQKLLEERQKKKQLTDICQSLPVKEIKMRECDQHAKRLQGLNNKNRRSRNKIRRRNLRIVQNKTNNLGLPTCNGRLASRRSLVIPLVAELVHTCRQKTARNEIIN
jgi:hypothetical protein